MSLGLVAFILILFLIILITILVTTTTVTRNKNRAKNRQDASELQLKIDKRQVTLDKLQKQFDGRKEYLSKPILVLLDYPSERKSRMATHQHLHPLETHQLSTIKNIVRAVKNLNIKRAREDWIVMTCGEPDSDELKYMEYQQIKKDSYRYVVDMASLFSYEDLNDGICDVWKYYFTKVTRKFSLQDLIEMPKKVATKKIQSK